LLDAPALSRPPCGTCTAPSVGAGWVPGHPDLASGFQGVAVGHLTASGGFFFTRALPLFLNLQGAALAERGATHNVDFIVTWMLRRMTRILGLLPNIGYSGHVR